MPPVTAWQACANPPLVAGSRCLTSVPVAAGPSARGRTGGSGALANSSASAAYTSVLPTAIGHGITTEQHAAATLSEVSHDAKRFPSRPAMWPLLIGAWKRKTGRSA